MRLFEKVGESGRLEGSLQAFPLDGVPEPEPFSHSEARSEPRRERSRDDAPRPAYRKERPPA